MQPSKTSLMLKLRSGIVSNVDERLTVLRTPLAEPARLNCSTASATACCMLPNWRKSWIRMKVRNELEDHSKDYCKDHCENHHCIHKRCIAKTVILVVD